MDCRISTETLRGLDIPYYNRYDSPLTKGGEKVGASVLFQMSEEGRNQEPAERYLEEQKAGDAWSLSVLRNQGIPNRQKLAYSLL